MSANVEEGVYRIKSLATHQDLTLGGGLKGSAEYGKVRCKDRNAEDQSKRSRQQKWLIVRVPGSDEWYNIVSLYWGVLASVFKDEREKGGDGEKWLETAPAPADSPAGQWKFSIAGDGAVRIHWRMEDWGQRMLDLKNSKEGEDCRVLGEAPGDGQRWILERDPLDEPQRPFAQWMSKVPGEKYLSELSIPATHQSIAINNHNVIENAVCQDRSIYEQLLDGVRVLDLRLNRWTAGGQPDCLFAYHGVVSEIFCWAAVLQSVKLFLLRFPGETVVVRPRNETGTEGFVEAFLQDFRLFADHFPDMFFDLDGGKRMSDVSLEQARGKVIGLIAKEGPNQLWAGPLENSTEIEKYKRLFEREDVFWGGGDDLKEAGEYDRWRDWKGNYENCRSNVHAAVANDRRECVFHTYWNVSGLPGTFNNPCHFVDRARDYFTQAYSLNMIGRGGEKTRSGLSWFDFYDQVPAVKDIIRSNVGCGDLDE